MSSERIKPEPTVAARTSRGAAWLIGSRLGTRLIDLATLAVLARVLDPAAFGLVAIAMTLLLIVEAVFELPVLQALVRIEVLDKAHFDTAFTIGAIRSAVLTATMAIAAWPLALAYDNPRLGPLVCVLALAPAMRGAVSPRMAVFAREISFQRDFVIEVAGKVAALVTAVTVALTTHSYWAIVAGTVVTPTVTAAASYLFAPYRPHLTLVHWRAFRGFLGWSSAAQVLSAFNWQCDRLILGHYATPAGLGRYSLASDLASLPETALVVPVGRPLMAAFALIRDDVARQRLAYAKASSTIVLLALPVCLGLSLLADPIVRLLLGGKWLAAIPLLRWLALASVPMMIVAPFAGLAMAVGRTDILFRQKLIEFGIKIPAMAIAAAFFGITGVVAVRVATSFILAVVTMFLVRRISDIAVAEQCRGVARIVASSGAMTVAVAAVAPSLAAMPVSVSLAAALAATVAAAAIIFAAVEVGTWQLSGRPAGMEAQIIGQAARLFTTARRLGRPAL